jgi:hypothetical protein
MSYPNNMTKSTLDSLIKAYADSISTFKQQEKINPLDLVLPGILSEITPASFEKYSKNVSSKLRYTAEHSVITSNGIIPEGFDTQQPGMSPTDPIRQSLGCFWVMNADLGPTYAKNELASQIEQGSDQAYYFYEPQIPDDFDVSYDYILQNGGFSAGSGYGYKLGIDDLVKVYDSSIGLNYNSIYKPGFLYRTPSTYYKTGIEFFEFTEPEMYGPAKTFDFKTPLFDLGFNQYIKIHYNFSKAAMVASKEANKLYSSDQIKKILPLTIFSGLEQKNEGVKVYYQKNDIVSEKTVLFGDTASPTNWEAPFPFKSYFYSPQEDTEASKAQNQKVADSIISRAFGVNAPDYYEDHSFYSKAAMSAEVTKLFNEELNQNDAIADVVPHYNFTSPFWEKAINNYQLFPDNPSKFKDFNKELVIGNIYSYCFNKTEEEAMKFEFDKYGKKLLYCGLDVDRDEALKYSNLFFLTPLGEFNKKVDDIKYQFPMYNEVTFKSETIGELGILLNESGIGLEFFSTLLSYIYQPNGYVSGDWWNTAMSDWENLESKGILNSGEIVAGKPYSNSRSIATKLKRPSILGFKPESYTLQHGSIGDYDFDQWLKSYLNYLGSPDENWNPSRPLSAIERKVKFFGLDDKKNVADQLEDFSPKKLFSLVKFMPKFQQLVTSKTRALHDIFSADKQRNKMAYSETIMYRISKVDQDTGLTMQSIFVPLEQMQDTIKYIDTQVRYGRPYEYKIFALKMVIGTEYKYKGGTINGDELSTFRSIAGDTSIPGDANDKYGNFDLNEDFISLGTAAANSVPIYSRVNKTPFNNKEDVGLSVIEVKYRPSVKVIEVPYYEEGFVTLVDNPPMPPLTNIYPLSGQKNKLLLTFENQTGDRNLEPVSIGATGDTELFDLHRIIQKRSLKLPNGELYDPTIRFKSDDVALYYQIFKIAYKKPLNYTDFSDSLVATVSMENLQGGYEDTIATNVKYYYTFRTIDRHGNISNPTPVYEVEMVEDSGVTYPIIKVLDGFEKPKNYVYSKPFRRYMMVDAADQHVGLNEEKTGIVNDETAITDKDPVLGTANKSLWNDKRFKFRIKSKQTGKTIDLNLQFKTRHIKDGNENTNLCD